MGMEAFTLSMKNTAALDAVKAFFISQGFVELPPSQGEVSEIGIELETADFVVEGLISGQSECAKVSLRFALSNPDCVDTYVRSLVSSFLDQWPTQVTFMSGTRQDLDFPPHCKDAVLLALDDQIPQLRGIWQSRTGVTKAARLRISEISQFMGWTSDSS